MKKILALILAFLMFNTTAHEITLQEYSQLFKQYDGCFILYNLNEHRVIDEYNPHNRCNERLSADSTFKIALSLMAFNEGIINQHTLFKWDGKKNDIPGWNQDQTPATWLKYSVVWVSQQITPQLGYARIKHYLAGFNYGNQDFSGDPGKNNGLTHAWLSSSLKISAVEQLHFLEAMLSGKLPVSPEAVANTEKNMYLGKLDNGFDYYGKTGSGTHDKNNPSADLSTLRDGWFVGFMAHANQRYIFISNLTDKKPPALEDHAFGSTILKPITLQLLSQIKVPHSAGFFYGSKTQ